MLTQIAMLLAALALPNSIPIPAGRLNQQSVPIERPAGCEGKTFATVAEAMQSGCCSWHGGVCGCSGGRKSCCDGTTSPSCGC